MNKCYVKSLTTSILDHLWCLDMSKSWMKYTVWKHFEPGAGPVSGQILVKLLGDDDPSNGNDDDMVSPLFFCSGFCPSQYITATQC